MKRYWFVYICFFLLGTFALISCGDDDEQQDLGPGENEVWMQNTSFIPFSITVQEGSSVTWINQDNVAHNTTSNDGLWSSGTMNQDDTFTFTFDSTGVYNYRCTIHPDVMTGQVVVE